MSNRAGQSVFRRWGFALALLALVSNFAGCVQRRFTIRSNPPGAQVYVDDYDIGTTPVSHDFIYYGTRKIRLVKDGYETLTVYQPMPTPWYQWPGLDFFSENLWPHEIRDEHSFNYQMVPTIDVPQDQLVGRAEQLRSASRVVPATAVQPVVAPPPVETLPPPSTLPPVNTLPAPNTLPPPNSFGPPPVGAPSPGYLPPPMGSAPNYGVPGTAPSFTPPPAGTVPNYGVPGTTPVPSAPILQPNPNIPPDWRPVGEAPPNPNQPVRR